jgi:hypothetical protein
MFAENGTAFGDWAKWRVGEPAKGRNGERAKGRKRARPVAAAASSRRLNDGSQAIYCLGYVKKESPSRGERYDLVPDLPEPTRCSRLPLVREMRVSGSVYPLRATRLGLANHTVPYGTDLSLNSIQAINCLATIISSLRDTTNSRRQKLSGT